MYATKTVVQSLTDCRDELKIAPLAERGRGRVIPERIKIEQQPDGDEMRKHQDEGERRGRNLRFAFTCRQK